jgi:phage terminase large subunit-like protein
VVEARQGYKTLSPTCKEFLRLLMSRGIELPRNPVLRWMADNVDVVSDPAENIKPVKRSATARIDGIVAILDALYGHIQAGGQDDSDYYATHDVVTL